MGQSVCCVLTADSTATRNIQVLKGAWGQELEMLETQLAKLVNSGYPRLSVPGWLASELGESAS